MADGTYGTAAYPSAINYVPKYFLINGKSFSASLPPVFAGAPGTSILVRLLNAGLETRVPTTEGASLTVIAEDGNPYDFARKQYTVSLPPGKTSDVLITSDTNRYIPLYDRRLALTNAATSPGGMLTYLGISDAAATNAVTVSKTGTGQGTVASVPGGIDCGSTCSGSFIANAAVTLVATPARGSSFAGWSGDCSGTGDCILPMTASANVAATFTVITKVRVIAPNGGETIPAKSTYVLRWEAPAAAETFRLEYKAGKKWVVIKDGVQESVYIWTVPAIAGNKKKAPVATSMVRVTGFDGGEGLGSNASDANFTIEMVRLTAPNGGETLTSGSTSAIQWTTFGTLRPVTQVDLQYQIKGGKKWLPITTITGSNPGSYNWTVPPVTAVQPNSKVQVTLRDATGILGQDSSNAIFTITPPPGL